VHNLKNIDVSIPRKTGCNYRSFGFKSSLAFDTIYAEGQRRYRNVFGLCASVLGGLERPDVDDGLSPVIIEQKTTSKVRVPL
jgi:excinuclease UvrABC ATPase subunit